MKKRLLSAALALAMVLTMLPMSVFAADPATTATGDGSETATYVDKNSATLGTYGVSDAPGWYAQVKGTNETATGGPNDTSKVRYVKIVSGFVVGGKYYSSFPKNTAQTAPLNTTFTSIGDVEADLLDSTSVTADVYSGALTLKGGSLTKITVKSTKYTSEGRAQASRGAVVLPTGWPTDPTKSVTLDLTNVTCAGTVTVNAASKGNVARSITLNNATLTGGATLNGTDNGDMTKTATQYVSLSNSSTIGAVALTGGSSSYVKIANSIAGTIGLTAPGGYVEVSGYSNTGKITVDSGDRSSPAKAVNVPSVRVTGTNSTGVAGIERATADVSTNASSFTISGGSHISVAISTANGSVTVTSSTTDAISVTDGSVTVNGPTAVTGEITLGDNSKGAASIKVTGTGNQIEAITNNAATLTVDLPADPGNNYGTITDANEAYQDHNVKGGTFTDPVPAGWLANKGAGALVYQLQTGTGTSATYTYYNASQLGAALTKQKMGLGNATLTFVGTGTTPKQTITFKNGDTEWGQLKSDGLTPITLPTEVAGVTVTSWYDEDDGQTYPAGGSYTSPEGTTTTVTLNAQESTTDVSKLINASAASNAVEESVYVSLGSNVITVSGGVASVGRTPITINLYTDVDPSTPVAVVVVYNSSDGSLTFAAGQTLGQGMTLEASAAGLDTLRLSNGTKYTLNGSGLKVLDITAAQIDSSSTEVLVTARVSGYNDTQNTELAKTLMGSGADVAAFDWDGSPLMAQALNAAAATISKNQIKTWITTAQQAAWRAKNNGTVPKDVATVVGGFDSVMLVPYLAVNVTAYNPNGTMTATLTPSYRVILEAPIAGDYVDVFKGKTNGDADGNYIAQSGRALTNLAGELGQVDVTLQFPSTFAGNWAHQDNTYAYRVDAKKIEITHGSTSGLGTLQFNSKGAPVSLSHKTGDQASDFVVSYYETLQAAVDDTQPAPTYNNVTTPDSITVQMDYEGSTAISVTGVAREFYVSTLGSHSITSNASGVIVNRSEVGQGWTVQLTKDTAAVGQNIVVARADGGSASVSANPAKAGSKVTISLSASAGYTPSGVSVKTASGQSVSVSGSGSSYSFTMPAGATSVTVTPSFTKTTTTIMPFTDVPTTAWYYNGVEYCYNTVRGSARLMKGMNDANTIFSPNSGFTRAQVVQILWNIKGQPAPKTTYNRFSDISSIHYAYYAMLWAVENGYVEGYPDGTFRPNQGVTRQEMAVFLWRAAGKPTNYNSLNLNAYTDGYMVYDWAQPAMRWAIARGVLSGQSSVALGNYLSPRSVACRSEVAVTVMNFDKLAVFR